MEAAMDLEQLKGRHAQLRQELSTAFREQSWDSAYFDRLADQIVATEREIASSDRPSGCHGEELLGFVQIASRRVV
jgi:hypothetical protein